MAIHFPEGVDIVFVFKGGPRDGDRSIVKEPGPGVLQNEARIFWGMTRMGTKCMQVPVYSLNAEQMHGEHFSGPIIHSYEVADKIPTETEITVILEYVGRRPPIFAE